MKKEWTLTRRRFATHFPACRFQKLVKRHGGGNGEERNSCQPGRFHDPDEHTRGGLCKHKPTDFRSERAPQTQKDLPVTHKCQQTHPTLYCEYTDNLWDSCTDLAQPKVISLYLLLTATQVPSVTSAAQTPCSCWTHRRHYNTEEVIILSGCHPNITFRNVPHILSQEWISGFGGQVLQSLPRQM